MGERLESDPDLRFYLGDPNKSEWWPAQPGLLYNAMIHPLLNYRIKGAIWYQGENNRNDGLFYEKKMDALIQGWRTVWRLGDFPFYYVQLAPFAKFITEPATQEVIAGFGKDKFGQSLFYPDAGKTDADLGL